MDAMGSPDGGAADHPHTNLADFLLIAAREAPDLVAVETDVACYTYQQLARMTTSVQVVLRRALDRCEEVVAAREAEGDEEAPPFHRRRRDEHVVCIVLERGPECLASVHAVMLEGCVYNTFDVAEPREKLKTWVEIAQHPVMITSQPVMARLGLMERGWEIGGDFPRFVIDVHETIRKGEGREHAVAEPGRRSGDLDRLCYVIFTSGSTGKPKAVMIQHRSACNLVRVWSDYVGVRHDDRLAQMASMAFDNHVPEVYGAMHKRCTSVVVPDLMKRSGPDMVSWLAGKHVNVMVTVPSHLRSMSGPGVDVSTAALPHLRVLDIGGEALGKDVLDIWAPGRSLFNIYGPTEITVVCAGGRVQPGDEITIGHDLPTYNNRVLDPETLQECPTGVRGVLYTGGVGTARGYLDDEAKTAAKFVEVPSFGRMYCSGDVVSRDEQGRFHYHGRADWQVKVRGIRIELEALEEAVGNVQGVKHCEARVVADGAKLVLIASGTTVSEAAIKEAAAKLGKGYTLNVVKIVEQSAWKFNTSGKLVRNHVPLEEGGDQQEAKPKDSWESFNQEGASELELEIARCVAQLVSAPEWGRESHFIEDLGLDSAGFGKLITLLRRKPELQVADLPMLFESPTVAALAAAVEARKNDDNQDDEDSEPLAVSERGDDLLDWLLSKSGAEAEPASAHALCLQAPDETCTYAQMLRRATGLQVLLKRALHASGSRPQHEARVVMLLLEPGANLVAAMVAAVMERHAFCIADPKETKAGLLDLVRSLQPCAVLAGSGAAVSQQDLSGALSHPCPLVGVGPRTALASGPPRSLRRPCSGAPFCCITAVKSSKGQLQLLAWEHEAVLWAARTWSTQMQLQPGDRTVPFYAPHVMESTVALWAAFAAGASVLVPPGMMRPGAGFRTWLRKQRATVLSSGPLQLRVLGAVGGASSPASLRQVWATGRQCPGDLALQWCKGRRFTYAYTSPEVIAACAFDATPEAVVAQGSRLPLGTPFPGCNFFVLSKDLDLAPPDTHGTLFINCPGMAADVFLAEDAPDHFFDLPDGRRAFASGFVARKDAAGTVVVAHDAKLRSGLAAPSFGAMPSMRSRLSGKSAGLAMKSMPGMGTMMSWRSVGTTKSTPRDFNKQGSNNSLLSFRGYLIQNEPENTNGNAYGEDSRVVLCFVVQSAFIILEPLMGAVSLVVMDRVIGPYSMYAPLWLTLVVLMLASTVQQWLTVATAVLLKWLLIGRYQAGDYAIYSTYYLKHWIVERVTSRSVLGGQNMQGGWNIQLGRNLARVLALKAMGCDISPSATVTTQVVGFDLVKIGALATVHGPHHLTAINYVGKRMLIGPITIGAGATVCHGSSVGATAVVEDGAFVEPLSTVPSGAYAKGLWRGVPGRQVGQVRSFRSGGQRELEEDGASSEGAVADYEATGRRLIGWSFVFLAGSAVVSALFSTLPMFLIFWLARSVVSSQDGEHWHNSENVDALPHLVMDNLWLFLMITLGQAVLQLLQRLLLPVLVCRLLPKIRAGLDVPLWHWRALVASIKLFLATNASQELGDASIQASYLRLLGARVGRGSSMSEQTLLPDTLSIGNNCFFASGNTMTSVVVDQGRMRVPHVTHIKDGCFLGNENHIAEGIQENTFVGLRTWVPTMPEDGGSLFGNPAMKFGRPPAAEGSAIGTVPQKVWHHFSTSIIDVFFWRILHSCFTGVAFIVGRLVFPEYSGQWWPLEFVAEVAIFAALSVLTWLLVPVGFSNLIYNDRMPLSAPYYSTVITRWFNVNKIRRVFTRPLRTSGSFWDATMLRLIGVHVGKRFFSPNDDVMIDPPFGRLGDDVTVDYDGQVRQHSFEDDVLKWGPFRVGNNANIGQAAMVAMSECADDVSLLRGSVTWKGQVLEAGVYEGAPAAPVDEDFNFAKGA